MIFVYFFHTQPKKKKTKKKQQNSKDFDEHFQFAAGDDFDDATWNLEVAIQVAKKKENTVSIANPRLISQLLIINTTTIPSIPIINIEDTLRAVIIAFSIL